MTAKLIDGKAFSNSVLETLTTHVQVVKDTYEVTPGLAVVLVGEDPASQVYVRSKGRRAEEVGFNSYKHLLPADTGEAELLHLIQALNDDDDVHGILVQLPLPRAIDSQKVIEAIDPAKDVDGFHPFNIGRLVAVGESAALVPCTPLGCLRLLQDALQGDLGGRRALVVGRSNIVGKPMASLLLQNNCTVTTAHAKTRDLPGECRQADILVAAVGRPGMIQGDWIKPGAAVIDVGINRLEPEPGQEKGKLVGDVDFEGARERAGWITPVPGGVGPMTIAMLMRNTLVACVRQIDGALKDFTL